MKTENPLVVDPNPSFSVTMSVWEWHHLLRSMEESMSVVNRDRRNVRILYGKIATQMAGHNVDVIEPEPEKPSDTTTKPVAEPSKDSSKTFLQRIFSN